LDIIRPDCEVSLKLIKISGLKKNLIEKNLFYERLSLIILRLLDKSIALSWLLERLTLVSLTLYIRLITAENLLP